MILRAAFAGLVFGATIIATQLVLQLVWSTLEQREIDRAMGSRASLACWCEDGECRPLHPREYVP